MKALPVTSTVLVILALMLSMSTACGQKGTDKVKNIGVAKFDKLRAKDDHIVLDVRTPKEWSEGTIDEAVEIDFFGEERDSMLRELDRDKTYLVYCRSGRRSAKTAVIMQEMGFDSVMNLKGGYIEWSKVHEE